MTLRWPISSFILLAASSLLGCESAPAARSDEAPEVVERRVIYGHGAKPPAADASEESSAEEIERARRRATELASRDADGEADDFAFHPPPKQGPGVRIEYVARDARGNVVRRAPVPPPVTDSRGRVKFRVKGYAFDPESCSWIPQYQLRSTTAADRERLRTKEATARPDSRVDLPQPTDDAPPPQPEEPPQGVLIDAGEH